MREQVEVRLIARWAAEDFLNAAYSQIADAPLIAISMAAIRSSQALLQGQISARNCQGSNLDNTRWAGPHRRHFVMIDKRSPIRHSAIIRP
jgi:hypothetical protein